LANNKIILLADQDISSAEKLQTILNQAGYEQTLAVNDGADILENIRAYQYSQEQFGLVIVDEEIPHLDFEQVCLPLTNTENGLFLPFIVLTSRPKEIKKQPDPEIFHLVYYLNKDFHASELLMLVELLLTLKQECQLRYQQEQELRIELSERKVIDAKLNYLVAHDELTGFLNRNALESKIKPFLTEKVQLALLFIDIDRFSLINEIEGFATGDYLIVKIAGLIRRHARTECKFARIGADEFCVLLENQNQSRALKTAEEIRVAVDGYRFNTGSVCYSVSISVGVVALSTRYNLLHPGEMISMAHQACQVAKTNGRNLVCLYNKDEQLIKERHKDVFWAPIIKEALKKEWFFLEFQPIVNLRNGEISHYEALVRLRDKKGEKISPGEFIPAAERMGMMHHIDLYVVSRAVKFLASLPAEQAYIALSINLSGIAFQDEALLPMLNAELNKTGIAPGRLTFEITETAAVENYQQTRSMIEKINNLGCNFALDDFGAGFSSFNYLKEFPVEYIKIDGQFIRNIVADETDQVLVRSMCEIARKLGKKTIAEFVDSAQVVSLLKEIGVDYGQGYLFGKPQKTFLENKALSI
jgi:diguanylate cyclase (GGDEF)-like protein